MVVSFSGIGGGGVHSTTGMLVRHYGHTLHRRGEISTNGKIIPPGEGGGFPV